MSRAGAADQRRTILRRGAPTSWSPAPTQIGSLVAAFDRWRISRPRRVPPDALHGVRRGHRRGLVGLPARRVRHVDVGARRTQPRAMALLSNHSVRRSNSAFGICASSGGNRASTGGRSTPTRSTRPHSAQYSPGLRSASGTGLLDDELAEHCRDTCTAIEVLLGTEAVVGWPSRQVASAVLTSTPA